MLLFSLRLTTTKCRVFTKSQAQSLRVTFARGLRYSTPEVESFDGPNKDLLEYLLRRYKREKVMKFRSLKSPALLHAIESIHQLNYSLASTHNPSSIPGVNDIAATEILNFFESFTKADRRKIIEKPIPSTNAEDVTKVKAIKWLQNMNGVGPIKAHLLWERGCKSTQQLFEETQFWDLLPGPTQKLLDHEKKTSTAIPRKAADCFLDSLRNILPEEFEIHLVSNYRLGQENLNELGVLIFHPTYNSLPRVVSTAKIRDSWHCPSSYPTPPESLFRESVVDKIKKRGLNVFTFSGNDHHWHGLMKIDEGIMGKVRFHLMPMPSKAAALLMLTGSPKFGYDCRQKAYRKGLRLNEYGLWRSESPNATNIQDILWKPIEISGEVSLMRELGIPYVETHERNIVQKSDKKVSFLEKPLWHVTKCIPPLIRDGAVVQGLRPAGSHVQRVHTQRNAHK